MSTYCLTLITTPLAEIESEICELFDVESLRAADEAKDDDVLIYETSEGWTILEDLDACFIAAIPKVADRLRELSAVTQSQIRSIAVQTTAGFVSIFVVESGRVLRHFEYCEQVSIDEGALPGWDDQIRSDPEGAAYDLLGFDTQTTASKAQPAASTPLDADLSKRFSRPIEPGQPLKVVSSANFVAATFPEVASTGVDGDCLSIQFRDGQMRQIADTDVKSIEPNPFTAEPVLHLQNGQLLHLGLSIAPQVWCLLEVWTGRELPRPTQPVKKFEAPMVWQLVPFVGALIGVGIAVIRSLVLRVPLWDMQRTVGYIGILGAMGYLIGAAIFLGYYLKAKRAYIESQK